MESHHYTRASTLPLILQSKRIRLTRADNLDDASEVPFKSPHIDARYFYVSSWTLQSNEQSGQWHRYGDASRGVRISFREFPFKWENITVSLSRSLSRASLLEPGRPSTVGFKVNGVEAPYSMSSMFGPGYILIPDGAGTKNDFGRAVTYVEDIHAEAAKYGYHGELGGTTLRGSVSNIAHVKARAWSDQEEYRYVILALAGPEMRYLDSPSAYENALLDSIEMRGDAPTPPPDVRYIDLPLLQDALDSMTVILGPLISDEDAAKVRSAIELYAPAAQIRKSELTLR